MRNSPRGRRRSWLRRQLNHDVDEVKKTVPPIKLEMSDDEIESPGARILKGTMNIPTRTISHEPSLGIGCFSSSSIKEQPWYESWISILFGEEEKEEEEEEACRDSVQPPVEMVSEGGSELSFQLCYDDFSDDDITKHHETLSDDDEQILRQEKSAKSQIQIPDSPESRRKAILSLIPQRQSKTRERRASAPFCPSRSIEHSGRHLPSSAPTSPARPCSSTFFTSSPRKSETNPEQKEKLKRPTMRRRSDSEGPEGFIASLHGTAKKRQRPRSIWSRWRHPLRRGVTRSSSITLDTPRLPIRMVGLANTPRAARRKLRLQTSSRIHEFYDISERIGKGAFGTVRKCTNKLSNELCAVKTVRRSRQNGAQGLSCSQANYGSDISLMRLVNIAGTDGNSHDTKSQNKPHTGSFFAHSNVGANEHHSIVEEEENEEANQNRVMSGSSTAATNRLLVPRNSSPRRGSSATPRHGGCITKGPATQEEIDMALRNEIEILGNMHHPNIVNLYDVFDDPRSDLVHMVMQLCLGGDLSERIPNGFSEMEAAVVALQMLLAIEYLHEMGIVHRDIKPANFCYLTPGPESDLVLIDFGISTFFQKEKPLGTALGTIYYTAPEVFSGAYGNKCDVWSIGVILYSLFTKGKRPFGKPGMPQHVIYRKIRDRQVSFSGKEWDDVSAAARSFTSELLTKDPRSRPSATQALKDSWFQDRHISTLAAYGDDILVLLAQYKQMNPLKKLAYTLIAKDLTQAEIGFLKQQYRLLDTDGDGNITVKELLSAIRALDQGEDDGQQISTPSPRSELEALLGRGQRCSSGFPAFVSTHSEEDIVLDMDEFIAATFRHHMDLLDENVKSAFAKFDRGCKGHIDENDLFEFFHSREYAHEVFTTVDTNSDGTISYDEFRAMLECDPENAQEDTDRRTSKEKNKDNNNKRSTSISNHKQPENDARPFYKRTVSNRRTIGPHLSAHSRITRYASSKLYKSECRINPSGDTSDGPSTPSTPFSKSSSPNTVKTPSPRRSIISSFL